ncbi:hypothetical protein EYR36_001424 [Pleurotus pulmonarius]|nr:hypothetical protein EYR36_001424 [Pleurotus pulmonarius]
MNDGADNSNSIFGLGVGDSFLVEDILPADLAEDVFERVLDEVGWGKMFHRGGEVPRLVAVQGRVDEDGSFPIYRHPTDTAPPLYPFTPTIERIRAQADKVLESHLRRHGRTYVGPLNHVLIQHYRTGADYISEHSDKTIDVVRGSHIINVSLGAERVMVLRAKRDVVGKAPSSTEGDVLSAPEGSTGSAVSHNPPRPAQRIPLPNNSMFVMGLDTNKKLLHGIPTDKRPLALKSETERSKDGARISLTFRCIGTFVTGDAKKIWGSGATAKTRSEAKDVILSQEGDGKSESLIEAFGRENRDSEFDWERWYGEGFDVINFGKSGGLLTMSPSILETVACPLKTLNDFYSPSPPPRHIIMMFSFFRAPGRLPIPSRGNPAPTARPPPRAHFSRSARRFHERLNEKRAREAALSHPYNRTLRRQGSLKAAPSLRKGAAGTTNPAPRRRAFMPGGIQSVASMSTSTMTPEATPSSDPATTPPPAMVRPAWMPGGFQPVAAPSFMEAEPTLVLPTSDSFFRRPSEQAPHDITDDDDDIFRRQMAAMMKTHHFRKGIMEHRDEMDRIVAERAKEAETERNSRTREEHIRLVQERLARLEAEQLEAERLKKEEAQRAEIERIHRERLAREAAEREARRREEERQRLAREAEERVRAEQARLAALRAAHERAKKQATESLQSKFFVYEGKWKQLKNGLGPDFRKLSATELPWPVFVNVAEPADITETRVAEFLLHPARPEAQGKARRLVLKMEVVRWHADRFDTTVLPAMAEDEREKTSDIACHVTRILTKLMNTN